MGLKLIGLPSGLKVYMDANIFLYSAFKHPAFGDNCREFLIKVDEGGVTGCVSDFVLNEVFHKLMIAEVVKKFKKTAKEAVAYIKRNSEVISNLEIIWREMDIIESSNIIILKNESSVFPDFVEISRIYNLMATDAMHVSVMKKHGITNIATNDRDFERVEWLKVWKP
jgi:predicted nucleic acid-binding protein